MNMEAKKQLRQFGLWKSQITPKYISGKYTLSDVQVSSQGDLVWLENRSGKGVLVVRASGDATFREINSDRSVKAGVGYGGGDFAIGDGQVCFVDKESGRLYLQATKGGLERAITPEFGKTASPRFSPDGQWIVYVRSYEGEDRLEIAGADSTQLPGVLVSGHDFYMQPAWHPEGSKLAWICWDHPNMPWDGTRLEIGEIAYPVGSPPVLHLKTEITGGIEESVFQPEFSPDGKLLAYISDRSGWWQVYVYNLEEGTTNMLTNEGAEYGLPAWIQGLRTYAFSPDSRHIYALRSLEGFSSLCRIDLKDGEIAEIKIGEQYIYLGQISAGRDIVSMVGSGPAVSDRVLRIPISSIDEKDGQFFANVEVIRRTSPESLLPEVYSRPESVQWTGDAGTTIFGLYYPPQNPKFEGTGKPPLIVYIHGGPTGQAKPDYFLLSQFFTSRGYAVLAVNYRGSAGYGRSYRNSLRGNWGIYDVQDAISGADYLFDQGKADPEKAVIMGGSAGGFTVLQALIHQPGFFRAGICLYGVSNQFTLADETHKFEAHYSESLLGPLPEAIQIYRDRSPIYQIDRIDDPMLVFQGEEDVVVPQNQMDEVVAKLRSRGVPVEYHLYAGEGHGFRKSETLEHFYSEVEKFLKRYVIYS
jgi:dipeptidyl aminopeptidase/acylaminoacyl peptidase